MTRRKGYEKEDFVTITYCKYGNVSCSMRDKHIGDY